MNDLVTKWWRFQDKWLKPWGGHHALAALIGWYVLFLPFYWLFDNVILHIVMAALLAGHWEGNYFGREIKEVEIRRWGNFEQWDYVMPLIFMAINLFYWFNILVPELYK